MEGQIRKTQWKDQNLCSLSCSEEDSCQNGNAEAHECPE